MITEIVNICITIDNKYVQHCAVTLTSLFINNAHLTFHIFIIHNDITEGDRKKLTEEIEKYKATVTFLLINENQLGDVVLSHHVSKATYYRLLLPSTIPQSLEKVLFLDADILIRDKIDTFLATDIAHYSHAAVNNALVSDVSKQRLGMNIESFYFNAGVLLINLRYWREANILHKSLHFLEHNKEKIVLWDQDVLNVVLENQWLSLPYFWNVQEAFYLQKYQYSDFGLTELEYNDIKQNSKILHFTGSDKPWFKENKHPLKEEYYKYLAHTQWSNYKPKSNKPPLMQRILNRLKNKLNNSL